jgi:hypothetical protein
LGADLTNQCAASDNADYRLGGEQLESGLGRGCRPAPEADAVDEQMAERAAWIEER